MTCTNGSGITRVEFQQALALHRQGRADEAARAYELVLLAAPTHLDALIHLGALRLSQGRADEAEALLRRAATKTQPRISNAHLPASSTCWIPDLDWARVCWRSVAGRWRSPVTNRSWLPSPPGHSK